MDTTETLERSQLRVRIKDQGLKEKDDELFATLTYGNVTIEIPYTYINSVTLSRQGAYDAQANSFFHAAIQQIYHDMHYDMDGFLHPYHRDGERFDMLPMSHNPLHRKEPRDIGTFVFYNEGKTRTPSKRKK